MKKLTIALILFLAAAVHAEQKIYMSYLSNGASKLLYVVQLSEKMSVEKVISMPITGTAGLTAISPGSKAGEFYVYFNMRPLSAAAGPGDNTVSLFRIPVGTDPFNFNAANPTKLPVKSNSLLNFSIDGAGQEGSLQRVNNRIDLFNVNATGNFTGFQRESTLPGQPYSSTTYKGVFSSNTEILWATLFDAGGRHGVRFGSNKRSADQTFGISGTDDPRAIHLFPGNFRDRAWFFACAARPGTQGTSTAHEIRGLDTDTLVPTSQSYTVSEFKPNRNPGLCYYNTSAVWARANSSTKKTNTFFVFDTFDNTSNTNKFSSARYEDEDGNLKRIAPNRPLQLPYQDNSGYYGVTLYSLGD